MYNRRSLSPRARVVARPVSDSSPGRLDTIRCGDSHVLRENYHIPSVSPLGPLAKVAVSSLSSNVSSFLLKVIASHESFEDMITLRIRRAALQYGQSTSLSGANRRESGHDLHAGKPAYNDCKSSERYLRKIDCSLTFLKRALTGLRSPE